MVNELKPCPYWMDELRKILREDMENFQNLRILTCVEEFYRNSLNTRPAAPVDRLDSYEYGFPSMTKVERGGDWCDRSQAEAIIAAKDAEIARLRDILDITERNELREAENNAALTARVKELEDRLHSSIEPEPGEHQEILYALEAHNSGEE